MDKYGFFNQPTPLCIGQPYDAVQLGVKKRNTNEPPFRPPGGARQVGRC